jgi:hypothetical protein
VLDFDRDMAVGDEGPATARNDPLVGRGVVVDWWTRDGNGLHRNAKSLGRVETLVFGTTSGYLVEVQDAAGKLRGHRLGDLFVLKFESGRLIDELIFCERGDAFLEGVLKDDSTRPGLFDSARWTADELLHTNQTRSTWEASGVACGIYGTDEVIARNRAPPLGDEDTWERPPAPDAAVSVKYSFLSKLRRGAAATFRRMRHGGDRVAQSQSDVVTDPSSCIYYSASQRPPEETEGIIPTEQLPSSSLARMNEQRSKKAARKAKKVQSHGALFLWRCTEKSKARRYPSVSKAIHAESHKYPGDELDHTKISFKLGRLKKGKKKGKDVDRARYERAERWAHDTDWRIVEKEEDVPRDIGWEHGEDVPDKRWA